MVEPIALYLGFDKAFFRQRMICTRGAEIEAEIEATADRYRRLLETNRKPVNSVLSNQARPEDLPSGFYTELEELTKREHLHDTRIRKRTGPAPYRTTLEDLRDAAGVPELTERQEWYVGERTSLHLARLMFPEEYAGSRINDILTPQLVGKKFANSYCRAFAEDYLRHVSALQPADLYEGMLDGMIISKVISSEGEGVFTFWTIAPYVHSGLRERGHDADESMARIFDWVRRAGERAPSSEPVKGYHNTFEHTDFSRFGIYVLDRRLGYDERMPTHLRSRLVSKVVAREL